MRTREIIVTKAEDAEGFFLCGEPLRPVAEKLLANNATKIILSITGWNDSLPLSTLTSGDTLLVKFKGNAGPGIVALFNYRFKNVSRFDELSIDEKGFYCFWWD